MAEELTLRETLDLVRSYETRVVRPFAKLAEVLQNAQQTIDHDLPAARGEIERLTAELADLRASKPDVEAAVHQAKARVRAAQDEADAAEHASKDRIGIATRLADARETELVRDFEFKGAALERDFTARRDALGAEIDALEAKKAGLDQYLAEGRKRF